MSGLFTLTLFHKGTNAKANSSANSILVTMGKQGNLWVIKLLPMRVRLLIVRAMEARLGGDGLHNQDCVTCSHLQERVIRL